MKTKKADEAMKKRIEKLVDVYCTFMFGVDRDAGWHAPSQLEALISASIVKNSGGRAKFLTVRFSSSAEHQVNDKADEKMINEISFVRKKHYDFELAKMLLGKLEDKQTLALIAGVYLNYVYKKTHSDQDIASYLKVEKHVYRHNKKRGISQIADHLVFLDQYMELRIA